MALISNLRCFLVGVLMCSVVAANADSILGQARAAYDNGEYGVAISLVEDGLRQKPYDFNLMELAVYSHLLKADKTIDAEVVRDERNTAIELAREIALHHPDSAKSYIVLANLDIEFHNYESAIANAETAKRLGSPIATRLIDEAIWRRDSDIHRDELKITSFKISEGTANRNVSTDLAKDDAVAVSETKVEERIVVEREKNKQPCETETIFRAVEQMPEFPGGEAALTEYIKSHIQYPPNAVINGQEGKVVLMFVVEKDGSVGEIRVARSVTKDIDREAVRLCKSLPKFYPGRQNGQLVRVWYTLPVTFSLQDAKEAE